MKPTTALICFFLLALMGVTAFRATLPTYRPDADAPQTEFATDRALEHVRKMSEKPHGVGFPAHSEVREYVVESLEGLGLEVSLQEGYTAGDWGNLSRAVNILARIPGSREGKALVLMSHYDSSPHSSYGASDAASGVATILEGLRAYLAAGNTPENDIIVLITDAEELGLNGADLFVNNHPWVRDVGLVLNFEGRGSGGPGFMLIETNRGNSRMIAEFSAADVTYPVANSLAYSIYKMLPNDTDLTVFREDADIEGFNFAFIDDHFDYHTALDRADRLDPETLAHQGSYLMPLLEHFSRADLGQMKSLNDDVYFNLQYYGLVSYPMEWSWAILALATAFFLVVVIRGLLKGRLKGKAIAMGFLPMLLSLAFNALTGFYSWPFLKALYPAYGDILHGFTYNGHLYIAAWASLAVGSSFLIYRAFGRQHGAEILVGPAFLWLVVCGALTHYLPGAAFFIIPVLGLLMALMISTEQENANPYILTALGLPALWMLLPMVKVFPVGLGLKMLVAASVMTTLIFFLLLGLLRQFPHQKRWGWLGILGWVLLLLAAHFQSGFDADKPKPTSLLYVYNADTGETQWATYEQVPSDWTRAYLGENPEPPAPSKTNTLSSKYGTGFSYMAPAPAKPIAEPGVRILSDTTAGKVRQVTLEILPNREVNRLEVFTQDSLSAASVNGIPLSSYYLENRRNGKLVTHYISDNEPTRLFLETAAGSPMELQLYEASNALLSHPEFSIPPRPSHLIPMPFVLNDAILVLKTIRLE
ncbi:M28 family peptidase [Robiginitalea sediminis]|uniref:M28 family peptidase n=1 Tax=Robiginitalea sediminis TaxID=1982593 RepID=UPI000B4B50CF|nr:M28 family peptidase [Robiginitalea sediminis]